MNSQLFAAYNLTASRQKENHSGPIPLWMTIHLIAAESAEAAAQQAALIGKDEASIDDGLTLNGLPAQRTFEGTLWVREIIDIDRTEAQAITTVLNRSVELAYLEFEASSDADIQALFKKDASEAVLKIMLDAPAFRKA